MGQSTTCKFEKFKNKCVVTLRNSPDAECREQEMPTRQGTIRNDGYVVRTLEAALWAFGRSTSFEEGCLLIANLGDDADTVAAIYGQVWPILGLTRVTRENSLQM